MHADTSFRGHLKPQNAGFPVTFLQIFLLLQQELRSSLAPALSIGHHHGAAAPASSPNSIHLIQSPGERHVEHPTPMHRLRPAARRLPHLVRQRRMPRGPRHDPARRVSPMNSSFFRGLIVGLTIGAIAIAWYDAVVENRATAERERKDAARKAEDDRQHEEGVLARADSLRRERLRVESDLIAKRISLREAVDQLKVFMNDSEKSSLSTTLRSDTCTAIATSLIDGMRRKSLTVPNKETLIDELNKELETTGVRPE